MSWEDYGFASGNDQALMSVGNTLYGIVVALYERYNLINAADVFGLDNYYNKIYTLYVNCFRQGSYLSALWILDYFFDFLSQDNLDFNYRSIYGWYVESDGCFLTSVVPNTLLAEACDELNAEGFTTTKLDLKFSANATPLEFCFDKNWIIQRKRLASKFRYALLFYDDYYYSSNSGSILLEYKYNSSEQGSLTDAENNLTTNYTNLTNMRMFEFENWGASLQYYKISRLPVALYITKSSVDTFISDSGAVNPRIRLRNYDVSHDIFDSVFPTEYGDFPIDLSNVVTINNVDYYSITIPFTESDWLQILDDNLSTLQSEATASGSTDIVVYFRNRMFANYTEVVDGHDSFTLT